MTRDEGTSSWYRKRALQAVPAVSAPRAVQAVAHAPQPRFVTKSGYSVQAISLDGAARYLIKRGPYHVAEVGTIEQVTQYVDLAELQQEEK